MTPETFSRVGRTLYGTAWQFALADALAISSRTIARWGKGERTIPDGIPSELKAIAASRAAEIMRMSKAL